MENNKNKVIKFSKTPSCYWSIETKISHLQRRILLYSFMYYRMNVNVISDYDYDALCYQLQEMQYEVDINTLKKTKYYYAFYDFEAFTGFHLVPRLNKEDFEVISNLAELVYNAWYENTTEEQRQMATKGIYEVKNYLNV